MQSGAQLQQVHSSAQFVGVCYFWSPVDNLNRQEWSSGCPLPVAGATTWLEAFEEGAPGERQDTACDFARRLRSRARILHWDEKLEFEEIRKRDSMELRDVNREARVFDVRQLIMGI
jgi:hypothetical protein